MICKPAKPVSHFLLLLFVTISSFSAFAITPSEYRKGIAEAEEHLEYIRYYDDEDLTADEFKAEQRATIQGIKEDFPADGKIEFGKTIVELNNRWFYTRLDEIEKEPLDSPKREQMITELSERLAAIRTKIDAIEKAVASETTKDQNKQKLEEVLSRPDYAKPVEKEESFLEKAWREFVEWLRKMFPESDSAPNVPTGGISAIGPILQYLIIAIVIGIVGFLLYRFLPFFTARFKNRDKREKKTRVILGETLKDSDTSDNLFDEAERLAREGNLRGALRKGYIALLCELSDRKLIGLAKHKTNRDYLRDVRKREDLYSSMNTATGSFERHWYGFEDTEQKDWEEFRQNYKQTLSKI